MKKYNNSILVIDDMQSIHEDFKRILSPEKDFAKQEIERVGSLLFDDRKPQDPLPGFQLDYALQGEEGLCLIENGLSKGKRYAIVFVDMIMPPGIGGIKTVKRIWELDKNVQIVICSAYSSHTWKDIQGVLGKPDQLYKLDKPFDVSELLKLTCSLIKKWNKLHGDEVIEPQTAKPQRKSSDASVAKHLNKAIESIKKIKR